jgi:rubrerythrin
MKIEEVIRIAIRMEEEGHDFYKKAEGCTADQFGKMMYASLAEDELRHKALLQKVDKSVCERVPATADDLSALEFAMGKERESHDMYRDAADSSADPLAKAVFLRMAQEEDQHFQILENTKYILEEYENWSIWEEGGPIEGG